MRSRHPHPQHAPPQDLSELLVPRRERVDLGASQGAQIVRLPELRAPIARRCHAAARRADPQVTACPGERGGAPGVLLLLPPAQQDGDGLPRLVIVVLLTRVVRCRQQRAVSSPQGLPQRLGLAGPWEEGIDRGCWGSRGGREGVITLGLRVDAEACWRRCAFVGHLSGCQQ